MPFGLSYNEAANPRAGPVRAWLTAAAITVTCQQSHTFHITVKREIYLYKPAPKSKHLGSVFQFVICATGMTKTVIPQPI